MSNNEPAYFTATRFLAMAYYRCYVLGEEPKNRLDNGENKSVTDDDKSSLRKETINE